MGHLTKDGTSWQVAAEGWDILTSTRTQLHTRRTITHPHNGPLDQRWDSLTGCCTLKDVTFWLPQRSNKEKCESWTFCDGLLISTKPLLYHACHGFVSNPTASRSTALIVFSIRVLILKVMELKALGETSHDNICVLKWYGSSQIVCNFTNLKLT